MRRYGFLWTTLALFLLSVVGHWVFGWYAYTQEARAHGQTVDGGGYAIEMARDTFENWQSEFLQLIWQVGGLALLLFVGSTQSKEGHERLEAKVDELLARLGADETRRQLDREFERT